MDDRKRVEEALKGSYTPLIDAIIAKNPKKYRFYTKKKIVITCK
jgi:hypothetical protein